MSIRKKIISGILFIGLVLVMQGCVVAPHGHYPQPYSQPAMVYWYYYPNYGVYYHPTEHYYYYEIGGIWRRSTALPSGWVLRDEPRVRLQVSGVPHLNYPEHRRMFPPRRVVVTPDKRDHFRNDRRPEYEDRRSGDSNRHRPDRDRKDERNIFVPHLKEEAKSDKFRGRDDQDRRGKESGGFEREKIPRGQREENYTKERSTKEYKDKNRKYKNDDKGRRSKDKDNRESKKEYKGKEGKTKDKRYREKERQDDGDRNEKKKLEKEEQSNDNQFREGLIKDKWGDR